MMFSYNYVYMASLLYLMSSKTIILVPKNFGGTSASKECSVVAI